MQSRRAILTSHSRRIHRLARIPLLAVPLLALMWALPPPAGAVLISAGDPLVTGWVVDNVDPGVTLDFTAHTPTTANSRTEGKLLVDVGHVNVTPLKFGLRQTTAVDDIETEGAGDGLRLLMDVIAANNGTFEWVGYRIWAVDKSPFELSGPTDHLPIAHFHNTPTGFASSPLVSQGPANNVTGLSYGLGTSVLPDDLFTASNILLHERNFERLQRNFDVYLQPIPEPATLTLFGAGLALAPLLLRRRARVASMHGLDGGQHLG